jgi:hypothetical protein
MRLRERGARVRIRSQATASRLAPVLEPTGKLSVPAPARAAGHGRSKRHAQARRRRSGGGWGATRSRSCGRPCWARWR